MMPWLVVLTFADVRVVCQLLVNIVRTMTCGLHSFEQLSLGDAGHKPSTTLHILITSE